MCLIFDVFQFSRSIPGPTVSVSNFARFSMFLAISQVLQCVFLILHFFQCFSPYGRSYSVCVSFSNIFLFCFLTIVHVPQCVFLIFHVFYCFSPHYKSYTVCFSFSMICSFLAIIQALQCSFLIVHVFKCFSPYSSSNGFCVSFSTFFQFSRHIPGETVFVSHFPRFSVF